MGWAWSWWIVRSGQAVRLRADERRTQSLDPGPGGGALPRLHHVGHTGTRAGREEGNPQGAARAPGRARGRRGGSAARVQEVPRRCPLPDQRRGTGGVPGSHAGLPAAGLDRAVLAASRLLPRHAAQRVSRPLGGAAALRPAGVRRTAFGPDAHVPAQRRARREAQVPVHDGHLADRDLVLPAQRHGRPRVLPAVPPAREPAPL